MADNYNVGLSRSVAALVIAGLAGVAYFVGGIKTDGAINITESAAPTGSAGRTFVYADSTSHRLTAKQAGNTAAAVLLSGAVVDADINASAAIADTKLATIATAGKVSDAALSANVPLKNAANVFSTAQDITPTNETSALDLYQSKASTGNTAGESSLRISRNGSAYTYDAWFNGGLNMATWLLISGHVTGAGDSYVLTPPTTDPAMIGVYSDVAGPCIQLLSNDARSPVLEVVSNDADPKYYAAIGAADGALMWGAATLLKNSGANWTAAVSTNVVTIDTIGAHGIVVGQPVTCDNFTVNSFLNDATYLVTAVTANTISFALTHADQIATTETNVAAQLKGRYDVGLRRTGAGALAVTDGGTGSGTLAATTFTGALAGNATTATTATQVTVANEATDVECFPVFVTDATGDRAPKTNSGWTFNSSSGLMVFPGNLSLPGTGAVLQSAGGFAQFFDNTPGPTEVVYTGSEITTFAALSDVNVVSKTMAQHWQAKAWDTGAAASKTTQWRSQLRPVSGNPVTSFWELRADDFAGNYSTVFSLSNAGTLTVPTFVGALTGNVTGDCSGNAANITGTLAVAQGGTGGTVGAMRPLATVVSQPTCSGAGPDTLVDYDIPANTLNANGAQVRFRFLFLRDTAANVDLRVSIGGTLVATWDHALANEIGEYTIVRTAEDVQKVACVMQAGASMSLNRAELTANDAATIKILITGTSTDAAVGTLLYWVAEFIPAP